MKKSSFGGAHLQFRHWTSDLRHQTILDRELTLEVFTCPFSLGLFPLFLSFSLMSKIYGLLLSESRGAPWAKPAISRQYP